MTAQAEFHGDRVHLTHHGEPAVSNRDTSVGELCNEPGIAPTAISRYLNPNGDLRRHGKQALNA
jgi:hypothetical protein